MASVKQIKEWIPEAINIFQTYLPCTTIPEIYIVNKKNVITKRNQLLRALNSNTAEITLEEYDSVMELIHGENGDAILIQQTCVSSPAKDPGVEEFFQHFFWHEMGHYFAITSETNNLHRYNDPGLSENREKQEGYWFWGEFIAEAISNHVGQCYRMTKYYHPELIEWKPENWYPITDKLVQLLDESFTYLPTTIDEYSLGHYFAYLLKDDFCQLFLKAADNCELLIENWPFAPKKMSPGDVDATGIISQPEPYRDYLHAMKSKLEKQLSKEHFWIIDENDLEELGSLILGMQNEKIALKAQTFTDTFAGFSPEQEKYFREQIGDEQFEAMVRFMKSQQKTK